MKKFAFMFLTLFMVTSAVVAGDYDNVYIDQVYIPENGSIMFRTHKNGSTWFTINEAIVGKPKYDKMYAQLLTALSNSKLMWVGTKGSTFTVSGMTIKR